MCFHCPVSGESETKGPELSSVSGPGCTRQEVHKLSIVWCIKKNQVYMRVDHGLRMEQESQVGDLAEWLCPEM